MDEKEKYLATIPKAESEIELPEAVPEREILEWYARKDKLRQIANTLYGNFIDVPGQGCFFQYMRSLPWQRVIKITELRPCEVGNTTLVQVSLSPRRASKKKATKKKKKH
jgi:hypothetical protein